MVAKSKCENGYAQLGAELGHTIRTGHFYMRSAVQVLGARVQTDAGVTFEAGYEGQLGKVTDIHSAKVSVRWTF